MHNTHRHNKREISVRCCMLVETLSNVSQLWAKSRLKTLAIDEYKLHKGHSRPSKKTVPKPYNASLPISGLQ